jgi:hypothetical protein
LVLPVVNNQAKQPKGQRHGRAAAVIAFEYLRMRDVEQVGGKNASLGEMISQLSAAGIRVPSGFATTAFAFREFLDHNHLSERIADRLKTLTSTTCARCPPPAPKSEVGLPKPAATLTRGRDR